MPDSVARLYGLSLGEVRAGLHHSLPVRSARAALGRARGRVGGGRDRRRERTSSISTSTASALETRLGRARGIMRGIISRAMQSPKRVVFPEGEEPKIIRAARILLEEGIAQPILLGNRGTIEQVAAGAASRWTDIEIEDPSTSPRRDEYAEYILAAPPAQGHESRARRTSGCSTATISEVVHGRAAATRTRSSPA